ncbi:uncharacterized protein [Haliotis asinina]|uniref:uncharacterized protein n=1 Tax=Haliotis asinina TaxID=109174 RepID=UPI0035322999
MFCKPDPSSHDSVMPPPKTHIGAYLTGGLKDLYHRIIRGKVLQTPDDGAHTNEKGHFWPGHDGPVVLARRYHVTEVLNTHGQSAVLVFAEDLFNQNKVVVIKILHTTYFNIGAQEAECLRRLAVSDPHHVSHTVKLLNTFVFGGHFCMVFESLSPHPITEVFGDLHFPNCTHLLKVKKLSLQLLVVLGFLRQQNTIHADLKPENILLKHVNDLSSVTVIDFGNSIQHVHKEVSLYYREFDVQTLLYRAPEVMFGIPFGTEIDMWSLGCILAELYLGRPLFFGKTKPELLTSITSILGPLPKEVFQRGKYSRELAIFTEDVEQEDATAKILECLEGSQDYAFANFLSQLFRYDPDERLSPSEAAQHPFLAQELCVSFLLPPSAKRPPSSILLNSKVYRHGVKISSEVKRQNPSTYDLLVIGTDRKIFDHGHHDTRVAEVQPYKQEVDTDQHSKGPGPKSPRMFLNNEVNRMDNPEERSHSDFTPFSPSRKQLYEYKERNDSGFYERMDSSDNVKRYARKPAFDLTKSLTSRSQQVSGQTQSRSPKHVRSQTRSRSPLSQSDRHYQNYTGFDTLTVKVVSGKSNVSAGTKRPNTSHSWSAQDLSPRSDRDKLLTDGRTKRNSLQCPVKILVKQDQSPAHLGLGEQESVWKLNQSHVSSRKTVEISPQRTSCSVSEHISDIFSSEDRKSHVMAASHQLSRDSFAGHQQKLRDFGVEGTGWKTVKQSPGQFKKKMKRKQLKDDTWTKFTEEEKHDVGKSEEETKYHPESVKDRTGTKFEDETLCPFLDGDNVSEDLTKCHALPQFSKRKSSSHDKSMIVTPGTLLDEEEYVNIRHSKPAGYQDNYEDLRGQKSKEINESIMKIIMSPKSKISRFNVSPNEEDGDLRRHNIQGTRSATNERMKSDTYKYETAVQQKSDPALVQSRDQERRASSKTLPVRVDKDFILSPRKGGLESRWRVCPRARSNTDMAKGNRRSLVENAYPEAEGICELTDEELPREEAKQMMAELTVPLREKMRRKKVDLGHEDRRRLLKDDIEVERSFELSDEELSGEAKHMMGELKMPPREKIRRKKTYFREGYRNRMCKADIDGKRSCELSDEELTEEEARQVMFKTTVPPRGKTDNVDLERGDWRRLYCDEIEAMRGIEVSDENSSGEKAKKMMFKMTVPLREKTLKNKNDSRTGHRKRLLMENIEAARSCEMSDDLSDEDAKRLMMETTVECEAVAELSTRKRDRVASDTVEHSWHPGGEQFRKIKGNMHVITDGERNWRDIDSKSDDKRMNQVNSLQRSVEKTHEDERWKKTFEEHKWSMAKISNGSDLHQADVERRYDKWLQVSFGAADDEDMDGGAHKSHAQREVGRNRTLDAADGQDEDLVHSSEGEEVVMSVVDGENVYGHIDASHSGQQRSDCKQVRGISAGKYPVKQTNGCISSSEKSNHVALKVKNSELTSPKTDDSLYSQRSTAVEKERLMCMVSQGSNKRERLERGRDFQNDTELDVSENIHFRQLKRSSCSSQGTGSDKSQSCSGRVDKSEKKEGTQSDPAPLGISSGYTLTRKTGHQSSKTLNQMDDLGSEDECESNYNHDLRTVETGPDHNQFLDVDDYKDAIEKTICQSSKQSAQSLSQSDNKTVGQRERSHQSTANRQMSQKPAPASQEAAPAPARSEDTFNVSVCGYEASVQDDSLVTLQPSRRRRRKSLAKRKLVYAKNKKMSLQDVISNTEDSCQKEPKLSNKTNIRGTKSHVRKTMRRAKPIDTETDDLVSPGRKGCGKLNTSHLSGSTKNPKSTLSSLKTKSLNKRAPMHVKGKRKTNQDQLQEEMQQGYHGEKRMRNGEKKSITRYTRKSSNTQDIISNVSNNSDSGDSQDSDVSKVCVNKRQRTDLVRSNDRSRAGLKELSPLASKGVAEAEYEQPALSSKEMKRWKQIGLLKDSVKRFSNLTERSRKTKNSSPRHTALDDSIIFLEDPDFVQSSPRVAGHRMVVKGFRSPSSTPGRRKKDWKKIQDADEDEILFLTT